MQLGSDKLLGIPLETYIPSEKLAIEFTSCSEQMEVLKSHLCKQRNIKLVKLPFKTTDTEEEYANRVSGYVGSGEVNTTVDIENAIAALPGGIGNMPVALELMVVGWMLRIVNIVVNTIVAARFIELYVYNAMASLSIATLCY